MRWTDWVNALILALATVVLVFKFLLWRLTKFWPFLLFVAAVAWALGIRVLISGHLIATGDEAVLGFWPLFTFGAVALYFYLRRYYHK
jgi:hypothetical protein